MADDSPASDSITILDEPDQNRFVLRARGLEGELLYRRHGDRLVLVHTEVPDALGGHGLGGRLVRAAVERAERESLTIVPWCPFARHWLREHPDEAAGVRIDWEPRPPS